jgi:hypothetical protein
VRSAPFSAATASELTAGPYAFISPSGTTLAAPNLVSRGDDAEHLDQLRRLLASRSVALKLNAFRVAARGGRLC